MNKVVLIGTLVADPETRTSNSGKTIASFRIAVRRSHKNQNGEYESDFLRCIAIGASGDLVSKYFQKGSRIGVEGSIQTSSWDKGDGTQGYSTDILGNAIEFIDRRGDAQDTPAPTKSKKAPNNSFKQQGFEEVADDDQLPF